MVYCQLLCIHSLICTGHKTIIVSVCTAIITVKIYLIKNTPGVKEEWPRTKTGPTEKDVKSNGWSMPPGFDRFESFDHDEFNAPHCCSRC